MMVTICFNFPGMPLKPIYVLYKNLIQITAMDKYKPVMIILLFTFCFLNCSRKESYNSWRNYRGDKGANCYSSLSRINKQNVNQLKLAWVFHTGDAREGNRSTIECNPLIVDRRIYVTSPLLKLYALDASTGEKIWMFDPVKDQKSIDVNRGLTWWEDGNDRRIFFPANDKLYAVDAGTGIPVTSFGNKGFVDLREGLDRDIDKIRVSTTSPGIIYKDLIIMGHSTSESEGAAPGYIRAYNVRSGKLVWSFHTIPHPGEFGYESWKDPDAWKKIGGANSWAGMALDEKRGIVYCPTGSSSPDFYGGNRLGQNLFANCLIALNAATGERIWHFQAVHHDLWDYDLPSTPNLITIKQDGKTIDAVAQITKMGHIFVFDRENGHPVFPIEERPVPESDIEGEETWPTQPFPLKPPPFVRQKYTGDDLPTISKESRDFAMEKLKTARNEGIFTPLTYNGTVVFPGFRGGGEWSGAAFDFETGILYVNANQIPNLVTIRKVEESETSAQTSFALGRRLYGAHCALCHGLERKGQEVFPSLIDVEERVSRQEMNRQMQFGQGLMPAFPQLNEKDREAIIEYISTADQNLGAGGNQGIKDTGAVQKRFRFVHSGYTQFLDEQGYPAVKPPWGTLNAIDMNRGEIVWQKPLGEFPELIARGIPPTGTQNFGGCLVTAGGLVFIGASADEKFRAFDKTNGEILWEYRLPFGGYATPASYEIDNKQYVVIAAGGGGKVGTRSGDVYIAFSLE
jgi:quinoprotein glucose dehydrogenase